MDKSAHSVLFLPARQRMSHLLLIMDLELSAGLTGLTS